MSETLNPLDMSGHKVIRRVRGVQRDLGPQGGHLGAVALNALLPKINQLSRKMVRTARPKNGRQNERLPSALSEKQDFRKQVTLRRVG